MEKLGDALDTPRENELVLEGTIQRFEYVIELFWKTFKRALEYEGVKTKTPRESVKEAYAAGWVHKEEIWLSMIESRNKTSHLYLHEELVEKAYDEIREYFPVLESTHGFLEERYRGIGL